MSITIAPKRTPISRINTGDKSPNRSDTIAVVLAVKLLGRVMRVSIFLNLME